MKNTIIGIALAMSLPFAVNSAPDDSAPNMPTAKEKCGRHWEHGEKLEHLSKELNLSNDQKAKLESLFNAQKEQFKAAREENQKQVRAVLTEEQNAKWEALRKRHHEHWQQKHDDYHDAPVSK